MDVIDEDDSRYEFRVKNCVFKGVYARFGYPELLENLCSVDNALYNTHAPDRITFTRGGAAKTIARGNATCDFICTASIPMSHDGGLMPKRVAVEVLHSEGCSHWEAVRDALLRVAVSIHLLRPERKFAPGGERAA